MSKCLYHFLLILLLLTSCTTAHKKEYAPPLWIENGKDIRYPDEFYITEKGEGDTQDDADKKARENILSQLPGEWKYEFKGVQEEVGKKSDTIEVTYKGKSTTKFKTKVRLALPIEKRHDNGKGKYYSLAVLDKKKESELLEGEVKKSYELTKKYLEMAKSDNQKKKIAGVIQNYIKARDELEKIELNNDILFFVSGKKIENELSLVDVDKELAGVMSNIKVSVEIAEFNIGKSLNPPSVTPTIIEGLSDSGFNVVSSEDLLDTDIFIKVKGGVNSIKKGEMDGIVYAYSNASITILDNKKGVVIKVININPALYRGDKGYDTKGSGTTPESAGLNSIEKISSIIKGEVVKTFNENFIGKGGD